MVSPPRYALMLVWCSRHVRSLPPHRALWPGGVLVCRSFCMASTESASSTVSCSYPSTWSAT